MSVEGQLSAKPLHAFPGRVLARARALAGGGLAAIYLTDIEGACLLRLAGYAALPSRLRSDSAGRHLEPVTALLRFARSDSRRSSVVGRCSLAQSDSPLHTDRCVVADQRFAEIAPPLHGRGQVRLFEYGAIQNATLVLTEALGPAMIPSLSFTPLLCIGIEVRCE